MWADLPLTEFYPALPGMKGFDALNDKYFARDFERLTESGHSVVATPGIGHSKRSFSLRERYECLGF
jgi:hypothetical protein